MDGKSGSEGLGLGIRGGRIAGQPGMYDRACPSVTSYRYMLAEHGDAQVVSSFSFNRYIGLIELKDLK